VRGCMRPCKMLLFAFLAVVPTLQARLLSAFTIEVAWPASHIVLAKETNQPGRFEVLDSWKGSLAHGSIIDVPDMVPLQSETTRQLPNQKDNKLQGSSIVLFLWEQSPPQADHRRWIPASSEMKTSVAWQQNSRMFCFLPDNESIDLQLADCRMTWAEMWVAVRGVTHEQSLLESIREILDKRTRAEELAPFLRSEYRVVRSFVFHQLEGCGQDGVPTIVAILHDPALLDRHGDAIKVLVDIEGEQAGPELTTLLDSDVRFWTAVGPTLKTGWWNQDTTPEAPLRLRYSRTIDLIRALDGIRFSGARKSVTALRDTWQSIPPLAARAGNRQMTEECNSLLNRLPPD
jgi:hypothetical protein